MRRTVLQPLCRTVREAVAVRVGAVQVEGVLVCGGGLKAVVVLEDVLEVCLGVLLVLWRRRRRDAGLVGVASGGEGGGEVRGGVLHGVRGVLVVGLHALGCHGVVVVSVLLHGGLREVGGRSVVVPAREELLMNTRLHYT